MYIKKNWRSHFECIRFSMLSRKKARQCVWYKKKARVYSFLPVRQTIPLCNDVQRKTIKNEKNQLIYFSYFIAFIFFFFCFLSTEIFFRFSFSSAHFGWKIHRRTEWKAPQLFVLHHIIETAFVRLFTLLWLPPALVRFAFSSLLSLSALWSVHVAINSNQLNLITNNMKLRVNGVLKTRWNS